jgi:hypothetical protein
VFTANNSGSLKTFRSRSSNRCRGDHHGHHRHLVSEFRDPPGRRRLLFAGALPGADLSRCHLGSIILLPPNFCRALSDIQGDGISTASIRKKLKDREIRQRALNLLWDLRESGVQIRNEFPVDFPNWHRRVIEWRDQVLDAAAVLSTNLRRHLQTLNETHGYPSDIRIVGLLHADEHQKDLSNISETLRRLEKYLERDL